MSHVTIHEVDFNGISRLKSRVDFLFIALFPLERGLLVRAILADNPC